MAYLKIMINHGIWGHFPLGVKYIWCNCFRLAVKPNVWYELSVLAQNVWCVTQQLLDLKTVGCKGAGLYDEMGGPALSQMSPKADR